MGNISIVIGSWGSYNECNERALGSKWLDLSDYSEWDEILDELKKQGFELEGIDEELFIQDVEGLPSDACDWDYTNPEELFNKLQESGVLNDNYKYGVMQAYLEVFSFSDFENLVDSYGERWNDDINLYVGMNWDDYGREYYLNCYGEINNDMDNFFDFYRYGEYIGYDCAHEYSEGIIEVYR